MCPSGLQITFFVMWLWMIRFGLKKNLIILKYNSYADLVFWYIWCLIIRILEEVFALTRFEVTHASKCKKGEHRFSYNYYIHHTNCDSVFSRVTSVNRLGHDVGTSSASILEYKLFSCDTIHKTQIHGRKHMSNLRFTKISLRLRKLLRVNVNREAHLRIVIRAVSTSLLLTDLMGPRPVAAREKVFSFRFSLFHRSLSPNYVLSSYCLILCPKNEE